MSTEHAPTFRLADLTIGSWVLPIKGSRWGWCPCCEKPTVAWAAAVIGLNPSTRYGDTRVALDMYVPCGCVAVGTALRGRLHIADVTRVMLEME